MGDTRLRETVFCLLVVLGLIERGVRSEGLENLGIEGLVGSVECVASNTLLV